MYKLVTLGFADERTDWCDVSSCSGGWVGEGLEPGWKMNAIFMLFYLQSVFILWDFQHCILIIISSFLQLFPDPFRFHPHIALWPMHAAYVTLRCGHPHDQPTRGQLSLFYQLSVTKKSLIRCRVLWTPSPRWDFVWVDRSCACCHSLGEYVVMAFDGENLSIPVLLASEPWRFICKAM